MAALAHTTSAHVARLILGGDNPDPVLLLGAGASVKSGIPAAGDMAARAAVWGYCREFGRVPRDPAVKKSDWWPWLCRQSWFDPDRDLTEQYPDVIERLLHPRSYRRDFFLDALNMRWQPSSGYEALADLAVAGLVRTVLTPNFDNLAPAVLGARPELRHVETVRSPDDLVKLSTAPRYPQVVFLHGSVEHYSDQNLVEETQRLESGLRDALRPLLKDHPIVVIGYRGAERWVMADLLLSGAEQAGGYRRGIFWCVRDTDENALAQPVLDLANAIGSNFQLVPIRGFDECMTEWAALAAREGKRLRVPDGTPVPVPVADLAVSDRPIDGLMAALARDKLALYRKRLELPNAAEKQTLERQLIEADLAVTTPEGGRATRAGELLFGRGAISTVDVRYGSATTPVRGNVFGLVERLLDMVEEINEPFRLKGRASEEVRPFDPIAVKELLVNALVHRDHDSDEPVRLSLSRHELSVVSPGGLLAEVELARLGQPGEKAYRNPVLADLLYGCGVMDKRGSGLADARRLSQHAGGDATFGPNEANTHFVAALRGRAEQPDPKTKTATAAHVERFVTNLVPARIEAHELYGAACTHRYRDIEDRVTEPAPFYLQQGKLWTFSELTDDANPLAAQTYGPVSRLAVSELLADVDRQRLVVQLLNRTLFDHARSRGLCAHRDSQRLWFPRSEDGARQITYQARVREATRTVTKPDRTRQTRWVHEACRFSFRRHGDDWVLHLVPGWVFTHDGYEQLLRGPGVGRLATRRSAREYNSQVANHLYFRLWVLAGEDAEVCIDRHAGAVSLSAQLLAVEAPNAPTPLGAPGLDPGGLDLGERDPGGLDNVDEREEAA